MMDDEVSRTVTEDASVAGAIVEAVAVLENRPWDELSPLHDAVDPAILERFVESVDVDPAYVAFPYDGYDVVIEHADEVVVTVSPEGPTCPAD